MLLNKLHILSPFQGLLLLGYPVPGVLPFGQAQAENTPVYGLSHLRCFLPDTNKIEIKAALFMQPYHNVTPLGF